MATSLQDRTVLVIGRGAGIARAVTDAARAGGAIGYVGVAVTNGAVDTGIWDSLGEQGKQEYFEHFRTHNPARRIGTVADIADAVVCAMTNPFLTGATLRVDGGEPLT